MSWIEKVKSELIITTGDGKIFKPLWLTTNKQIEYNIAEFEFPDIAGTLVKRGTPKGSKFALEIIFQGEDHLDQALAFEQSANDKRPWVVSHPFYSSITVHPTSLLFDNSQYNISKITGTIIETITEDRPKISIDPAAKIADDKIKLDEKLENAFDITPGPEDINTMVANNTIAYNEGSKIIKETSDLEEFFNLYNVANTAMLNATAEPLAAIKASHNFLNYPALLQTSVENRIGQFTDQFNLIRVTVSSFTTREEKKIYENHGSTLISAACLASVNPIVGDYGNKRKVFSTIELLIDSYNLFLEDLDALQSDNGGDIDSYIPDATAIIGLNSIIKYTIANLFKIALESKQERTVIIEDDSNLIMLAHRFYGLKADDSTIDELITNNDLGLNSILQVRKGTSIKYYI